MLSSSDSSPETADNSPTQSKHDEHEPHVHDSSSDKEANSDDERQNLVTQKAVFGSDTESDEEVQSGQLDKAVVKMAATDRESASDTDSFDEHEIKAPLKHRSRVEHLLGSASESSANEQEQVEAEQEPNNKVAESEFSHSRRTVRTALLSESDEEAGEEEAERPKAAQREQTLLNRGAYQSSGDEIEREDNFEDEVDEAIEAQADADDATPAEMDEAKIAVDCPLIRADLGREMHLVKMPNFLSVETRPFDPNFYEDELDEDEILDEEGRTRLKLKVENTIRWRVAKTANDEIVHESNARIVRWSDGSLSLHLGDEIFDIHKVDIQSDYNYLFIREGSGLQGQSSFKTKLTFRPHSTDSFTHRKITLSLADKTNKSQKVKILPVAGADPETNRNALVRKEEEQLRASLRRESQLRRMREKQAMTRSSLGGSSAGRRSYADTIDGDDDDDENGTSLNALKRAAKASLQSGRKDVSAIYSSESESLSDLSEPSARKKVRARISDEGESD